MKTFSLEDIPEFSKKECIVVVGIIGKSPYRYPNKTTPLLPSVDTKENGIECHWDERRSVLYLHAVTDLDAKQLAALAAQLDENSNTTEKDADASHWLVAAGELAAEACKLMALIFHLCHIVVLSSPTPVFDLGYLQLFKAIDAYRTELSQVSAAALAPLGGAWESHGRACCPRLLFHFRRAPHALRRAPAALKRLEHAVEDQLYFILRKARIITNVCAKSLFAIPKNEEFVYISAEESSSARDVGALVRGLVRRCAGAGAAPPPPDRPGFRHFLQGHVDLAFQEGFDDNVGKYAMSTSFFELPGAAAWRAAARALRPLYAAARPGGALHDALATDVRFSQARCAKVLPIAQASYAEGLPAHYSSQHHAHKVNVALGVLHTMARGPVAGAARARLRAACAAAWRTRSLCEALSLTHHPCIHPDHDGSREHSSGVRYISACNCGRSKSSREDPYTVRAANCTFYAAAALECAFCSTLTTIEFPVFAPSTPTYRAASVKGGESQEAEAEARASDGNSGGSAWSAPDALSPGSAAGSDDASPQYLVPLRDSNADKVMTRQPSTTEYLPGMLHTLSPPGLLPAFSSWSLVCLGPSSLYSHSPGLGEHLQPGFLPHTNYLLPWDAHVRSVISFSSWSLVCLGPSSLYSHSPGLGEHLQPGFLPHTNYLLPWDAHVRSVISFSSWSLVCLGPSSLYSHSPGLGEHLQPGFLPHTNYLLPWDAHVRSVISFSSWSLVCLGPSSLYSHSPGLGEHLQPGFLPHTNYLLPWDTHVRSVISFSSWSLVCLGPSSLYSHSPGLGEHLQPGFLPHTNYLLPWDAHVRSVISFSSWSLVCRLGPSSLYSHSPGLGEHLRPGFLPHTNYLLPWDAHVRSVISFSSWSLVCLGPSSLYSHSPGLGEHLRPGFLPHTNYLLPWDAHVRMEQVAAWRVAQASARGRGKPAAPHHLTVKIFIGLEYECPRGHRFMMSSPDTVVNGGGGGACGREAGLAGARLAAADMPLYSPCLCRASSAMLAQLTRVHVVTPKAPVHVTLDPKVQPVVGGPVFVPQPGGAAPLQLTASAYWVLRLPHSYADERGPLPRPRAPQPAGLLLAPLFGLRE